MRILWICGLPEEVRLCAQKDVLSHQNGSAWGWILGHLPPPEFVELHILCTVRNLAEKEMHFHYKGAMWHCFCEKRGEQYLCRILVMLQIRKFVKILNPDVINGWGGETGYGWIAVCLSRHAIVNVQGNLRMLKANEKTSGLIVNHGRWLDWQMREWIELLTYRCAFKLIVESVQSQMALRRFYGLDSHVIYHPLRTEFLDFRLTNRIQNEPTFLYVGELVNRKGPMDVLNAFSKSSHGNSKLYMVGGGCLEKHLKDFVKDHGLSNRVFFARGLQVDELKILMSKCDFFILPSYGDTGPTSLKEALSQGLYPICYDNTGPKEHIERYGFGALGETGNWHSLVSLINEACERRGELREEGCRVAERIKRDLSPENIWPELLNVYNEVINA